MATIDYNGIAINTPDAGQLSANAQAAVTMFMNDLVTRQASQSPTGITSMFPTIVQRGENVSPWASRGHAAFREFTDNSKQIPTSDTRNVNKTFVASGTYAFRQLGAYRYYDLGFSIGDTEPEQSQFDIAREISRLFMQAKSRIEVQIVLDQLAKLPDTDATPNEKRDGEDVGVVVDPRLRFEPIMGGPAGNVKKDGAVAYHWTYRKVREAYKILAQKGLDPSGGVLLGSNITLDGLSQDFELTNQDYNTFAGNWTTQGAYNMSEGMFKGLNYIALSEFPNDANGNQQGIPFGASTKFSALTASGVAAGNRILSQEYIVSPDAFNFIASADTPTYVMDVWYSKKDKMTNYRMCVALGGIVRRPQGVARVYNSAVGLDDLATQTPVSS